LFGQLLLQIVNKVLRAFRGKQRGGLIRHVCLVAQALDFVALFVRHDWFISVHATFALSRISSIELRRFRFAQIVVVKLGRAGLLAQSF
jgi:hypothetical protein